MLLAALNLDERSDRRLVDGDDHVLSRELFPVFLVAEPHVQTELTEDGEEHVAIGHDRLELLAQLHHTWLHGTLEGQETLAAFAPYAKYRSSLRSEEHTSELQSLRHLVCRLL